MTNDIQHLCNEPKTFVVKIYGLFRITYPNFLNSQQTWVLIMGNGFPPDIKMDEVFDLKVSFLLDKLVTKL